MKAKLFDYIERDNFVFNLSGVTKLICFLLLSFGIMLSFDARVILGIMILSFIVLHISEIKFKQVRIMMYYIMGFLVINFFLTFLFSPHYGEEIYGTSHVLFRITDHYYVTSEQLLYQFTKMLKYAAVIPLGMMFIFTTNPSEFAASLNKIGVSYSVSYSVALALRYIPDIQKQYHEISQASQARGVELSKKASLVKRLKSASAILIPLILSSMDRIEIISNAMELRCFGKNKKRTWYMAQKFKPLDYFCIIVCALLFAASIALTTINGSRFYNPFI